VPKRIDVYFENVGGKVFEAVLQNVNPFCRIPVCGAISMYNATSLPDGPNKLPRLTGLSIGMRLRMQGFIVTDYQDQFDDFQRDVSGWIRDGSLKYKEDIASSRMRCNMKCCSAGLYATGRALHVRELGTHM